jgi:hypothetical protein
VSRGFASTLQGCAGGSVAAGEITVVWHVTRQDSVLDKREISGPLKSFEYPHTSHILRWNEYVKSEEARLHITQKKHFLSSDKKTYPCGCLT